MRLPSSDIDTLPRLPGHDDDSRKKTVDGMSARHGMARLIHAVPLNDETRDQIRDVLLHVYADGYLVIEHHEDGETWLSTGDETLVVSLLSDSFNGVS
jgi:hypothetical protein